MPIILPLIAGLIMVIFRKRIHFQRIRDRDSSAVGGTALQILEQIEKEGVQVLQIGDLLAPFGISLVADSFEPACSDNQHCLFYCPFILLPFHQRRAGKALLLSVIYVSADRGLDRFERRHFNLFVHFEVMLVSSYVLLSAGRNCN